jgi:proteasome alpha subunit
MIEEPYRWVEAIANRREYIEAQLASGSPIAAVSCNEGILFVTLGRARQKVFEIYDRIAMGAIGHPGDIERLRMAAIELASTEGFTRSAADVSLRRLAHYSLSPVMKAAFEQVYGPPYLARLLFAEVGGTPATDSYLRLEYDGAISTNGSNRGHATETFAALCASAHSTGMMESFLREAHRPEASLEEAISVAVDAWSVGHMTLKEDSNREMPGKGAIAKYRQDQLATVGIEAAILERNSRVPMRYRSLSDDEVRAVVQA